MNFIKSALTLTRNLATNFAQSVPSKTNFLTNNPALGVRNLATLTHSLPVKTNYFTWNPIPSGKSYLLDYFYYELKLVNPKTNES